MAQFICALARRLVSLFPPIFLPLWDDCAEQLNTFATVVNVERLHHATATVELGTEKELNNKKKQKVNRHKEKKQNNNMMMSQNVSFFPVVKELRRQTMYHLEAMKLACKNNSAGFIDEV